MRLDNGTGNEKHPHVRGENQAQFSENIFDLETPPRAWGKLYQTTLPARDWRNTPTCVGKTRVHHVSDNLVEKHPHVRGENYKIFSLARQV